MPTSTKDSRAPRTAPARQKIRDELLAWYALAKRDLPWRRTSDPYAIWISETMLQQTRVETVIDYWRRFLARFPDLRTLAEAEEDEVLALWSGLGYYRRARSLHAAAQQICEATPPGEEPALPDTPEELLALPGVGRYTAGAIASIAYGKASSLVDGNVGRVFSRLFGIEGTVGSGPFERALWDTADALVPQADPGTWNQALMELGATLCTPKQARCDDCPWRQRCVARAEDRVLDLPAKKPKPAPIEVRLRLLVCVRKERILLERRPATGRMAGLWQLPTIEIETASGLFPATWPEGQRFDPGGPLGTLTHGITKHKIRAELLAAQPVGAKLLEPFAWHPLEGLDDLGLTGMAKKARRLGLFDPGLF